MTTPTLREQILVPLDALVPYARNARTHSPAQVAQLAASIREFGWTNPVLIDEAGGIIAGHGRVLAARELGMQAVPCLRLTGLTEAQKRAYVLADNRLALNAGWDEEMLARELAALGAADFDLGLLGFDEKELARLLGELDGGAKIAADADAVPEVKAESITRAGDLWRLDDHRLLCGDSTQAVNVERLFGASGVDLILTDPPYCSGGFQESGRSSGSVGTNSPHKQIANDRLSTRGYIALIKAAVGQVPTPYAYVFTDWRMWVVLFDVMESSGFGVRAMVVWDKGTPGMGRGWRSQHELVMWCTKEVPPFDKHSGAFGNVIRSNRTGNLHHTTEKPVDLIAQILDNTPFGRRVYDPFAGSGTTLVACQAKGRTFCGMELDPLYVDVAVRRWQNATGRRAVHDVTGEPFAEPPETA